MSVIVSVVYVSMMFVLWLVLGLCVDLNVDFVLTWIGLEALICVFHHRLLGPIVIVFFAGNRSGGSVQGVFLFISFEMGGQLVFVNPSTERPSWGCRLGYLVRVWTPYHLDVCYGGTKR
ncbi:hypothetical protein VMCG_00117 [Cytospora schulzeri]|uniref:Uncharacterized protein n=1 Tax=Cytospora schulzeri TaxID=448051 RepID=A0A423X9T9_9PEZI|nr:hypothetical protein VMCG_00117 [Valsa malicola]